jgi:hypothetical protein
MLCALSPSTGFAWERTRLARVDDHNGKTTAVAAESPCELGLLVVSFFLLCKIRFYFKIPEQYPSRARSSCSIFLAPRKTCHLTDPAHYPSKKDVAAQKTDERSAFCGCFVLQIRRPSKFSS